MRHSVQREQGTGFACQASVVLTRIKKVFKFSVQLLGVK